MLEGIALSLINTLISFMFEQYLHTTQEIKIDGAPSWYYQENNKNICSYTYLNGEFYNIDLLKLKLSQKLEKKLININDKVIYQNFDKISSIEEKEIINSFKRNMNFNDFIRFNITFAKIEYEKDVNKLFGKGCIDKKTILSYNKTELRKIIKSVSLYKSEKEFQELKSGNSDNSYFNELDSEF